MDIIENCGYAQNDHSKPPTNKSGQCQLFYEITLKIRNFLIQNCIKFKVMAK